MNVLSERSHGTVPLAEAMGLQLELKASRSSPGDGEPTATAASCAPDPGLPDWAIETPGEMMYDLEMCDPWKGCVDGVKLTRQEFIALKRRLAEMRGYKLSAEEEAHAS